MTALAKLQDTMIRHRKTISSLNQSLSTLQEAADLALRVYNAVRNSDMPVVVIGSGRLYENRELAYNFGVINGTETEGAIFNARLGGNIDSETVATLAFLTNSMILAEVRLRHKLTYPNKNLSE